MSLYRTEGKLSAVVGHWGDFLAGVLLLPTISRFCEKHNASFTKRMYVVTGLHIHLQEKKYYFSESIFETTAILATPSGLGHSVTRCQELKTVTRQSWSAIPSFHMPFNTLQSLLLSPKDETST